MPAKPKTVREQIAFSYSQLACAHSAINRGAHKYATVDYMIRAKLRRGLIDGSMRMRSIYDDERNKLLAPQACYYCGSKSNLCADHLIPRMRGGPDASDNLISACRSCNSSKGGSDLLSWMDRKGWFPPLLLLRRYMKIVARHCQKNEWLDLQLDCLDNGPDMPFDVRMLPISFPPLRDLTLWVYPEQDEEASSAAAERLK
ncbi:MAG: HNH endonuclease [Gammaproteobacteria bacterium]|nr:HNH endonuclease [Gammaproteobacteria bacterium]MYD01448.1 HNH endonuclease [Gammaproteobacteria bacterium]MYI23878.1 HNH endonuclease [Gammaproteobacteria bacterium]